VIDIYLGYKNELKKAAITWGNNLDPETGEKFISQLSAKEKEWGDWLLGEYDANYERLKKAHIEYTNRAIGHEENYIQNAKDIRSIQKVVNDREWTAAVRQMKGSEYVKAVQKWANLVGNPSYYSTGSYTSPEDG